MNLEVPSYSFVTFTRKVLEQKKCGTMRKTFKTSQ